MISPSLIYRHPDESRGLGETRRDFLSWGPGFRRDDGRKASFRRLLEALPVEDLGRAALERRRRAGDRVGQVEIVDRVDDLAADAGRRAGEGGQRIDRAQPGDSEARHLGGDRRAKLREIIERQGLAERSEERREGKSVERGGRRN